MFGENGGLGVVKKGREVARSQECLRHWGVAFTDIICVCHLCWMYPSFLVGPARLVQHRKVQLLA